MNILNRKNLVIGNWKMHLTVAQASHLSANLHKNIRGHHDVEVVLAPNNLSIQPLSLEVDRRRFRLASQNAYHKDQGGFTGETSFAMLRGLVDYGIIGHSERRIYFGETNELVRDKVAAAVRNRIIPVICVGETASEKSDGQTKRVIHDQMSVALSNLTPDEIEDVVIAYEPVWAISNLGGKIAYPDDIAKIINYIRGQIHDFFGERVARSVRVLYGGSVDNHNVSGFLAIDGCDGVLVGSASLNAHKFSSIVEQAYKLNREKSNG